MFDGSLDPSNWLDIATVLGILGLVAIHVAVTKKMPKGLGLIAVVALVLASSVFLAAIFIPEVRTLTELNLFANGAAAVALVTYGALRWHDAGTEGVKYKGGYYFATADKGERVVAVMSVISGLMLAVNLVSSLITP